MNLWTKTAATRLLTVLLLCGEITACQTKQAQENRGLQQSLFTAAGASQSVQVGDTSGKLFNQGRQRSYFLHTPRSYHLGHPLPLVLAFHEYGGIDILPS